MCSFDGPPVNGPYQETQEIGDWDSEDGFGPTPVVTDVFGNKANKSRRVVVLKYMLTLDELGEYPSLLLDLK